jgi:hypothetical protein
MAFQFLWFTGWLAYFIAGAFVAASLLFSILTRPRSSASKIEDLQVQTTTYGNRIKEMWGRVEFAPQIIFAKRYRDDWTASKINTMRCRKESIGGDKDNGEAYHAYCTIALGICAGPIDKVTRIKANGNVIYEDRIDSSIAAKNSANVFRRKYMTVYRGTSDQDVDPILAGSYDRVFANNDINFKDKTGINHDKFSFGLKKSLFNYMHGICFDYDLQDWRHWVVI